MTRYIRYVLLFLAFFVTCTQGHAQEVRVEKNLGIYGEKYLRSGGNAISIEYSFASQSHKKLQEKLFLSYQEPTICKEVGYNFYGNATHPQGGRNGRLNERNDGYGFTCYLNESRTRFFSGSALVNSQYGLTVAWSFSQGITLIDFLGFRFDVGVSPTMLSYEKRDGSVVYGVLPITYKKISVQLPKNWGIVSVTENNLGKGILLRNAEVIQSPLLQPSSQNNNQNTHGFQITFSRRMNIL